MVAQATCTCVFALLRVVKLTLISMIYNRPPLHFSKWQFALPHLPLGFLKYFLCFSSAIMLALCVCVCVCVRVYVCVHVCVCVCCQCRKCLLWGQMDTGPVWSNQGSPFHYRISPSTEADLEFL